MTKHEQVDPALKCHLEVEEASKMDQGSIGKMFENNAFVIADVETVPHRTSKQKRGVPVRAKLSVSKLGKVARKLYDLEPVCEPEKTLKIDLDLYQMEDF